ncbi:MAG: hypothetical protein CMB43_03030 [Euryarchaeota archaeon]|nr:hypothetical protein [Euryarchaeota archaeon]
MSHQQVSLIAINAGDVASLNQGEYLLTRFSWKSIGLVEGKPAYQLNDVRMWIFEDGILFEDNIDKRWSNQTTEIVREVIFPSRHSAASGKPSLTLHPIGVPQLAKDEQPKFGGRAGFSPPPSTRLASWWKMLHSHTKDATVSKKFELTLEVTHHGPWLDVPAMFIEIGSTERDWPNRDAAKLLGDIISEGMALDGGSNIGLWDSVNNADELVLVTLGGGHYAPRANKLALVDGVWLGHMLATYALPFLKPENDTEPPGGTWQQAIDSAISATKQAFPNGKIICSMDKKAFRGWQRQAIRDYLSQQRIPLLTTKQILEALGK